MLKGLSLFALLLIQSCAVGSTHQIPTSTQRMATLTRVRQSETTLILSKTNRSNILGNPIWALTTPSGQSFDVVTGRSFTQSKNRHQEGTEAPLPPGTYYIGKTHHGPFSLEELGNSWFIDLIPQFNTGRTELGIHLDPSFGISENEDGTSGCIGMTNPQDLNELVHLIETRGINKLVVSS